MSKERKCPECQGVVKPGQTELVYELEDIKITVKNITANVCEQCGRSFVSGWVAGEVNRLVNRVMEDVNSFLKTGAVISGSRREIAIAV